MVIAMKCHLFQVRKFHLFQQYYDFFFLIYSNFHIQLVFCRFINTVVLALYLSKTEIEMNVVTNFIVVTDDTKLEKKDKL